MTSVQGLESSEDAPAVVYLRVSTKDQARRNGEPEGYSLPAQRGAVQRKAEGIEATIIEEFVEGGETATNANRPELQRLLAYIAEHPVKYVIVHKLDRLIRNRFDDFMITVALDKAGAQLVSCSEHIDKTPAGKFTHGLMALVAEWYSGNLSEEMKVKLLQKVRNGGTIGKAPPGYLNIRKIIDGYEVRTVEIDPVRAPLVKWAFEVYATGEWSLTALTDALEERGLTTVPTKKLAEKPLGRASVHRMLRNPYYVKIITWQGIQYAGAHPQLIDQDTFDRVQHVLDAHNKAGEKRRVHHHYLKGSVYCGKCGSRLCITKAKNRHGTEYLYFFCLGNYRRLTDCDQGAIPVDLVEARIEQKWRQVQFDPQYADAVKQVVQEQTATSRARSQQEATRATSRIAALTEQRRKLLEAHYADALPLPLLKEEQARITKAITDAEQRLAATQVVFEKIEDTLQRCLTFLKDCHAIYRDADDQVRRQLNQAVFEHFLVDDAGSEAEPTGVFGVLLQPDLLVEEHAKTAPTQTRQLTLARHRGADWHDGVPARLYASRTWRRIVGKKKPPELVCSGGSARRNRASFLGLGLNKSFLAEREGFEPSNEVNPRYAISSRARSTAPAPLQHRARCTAAR
jgi:site-specific DNA recombinase